MASFGNRFAQFNRSLASYSHRCFISTMVDVKIAYLNDLTWVVNPQRKNDYSSKSAFIKRGFLNKLWKHKSTLILSGYNIFFGIGFHFIVTND